jgi:hypothetical protein
MLSLKRKTPSLAESFEKNGDNGGIRPRKGTLPDHGDFSSHGKLSLGYRRYPRLDDRIVTTASKGMTLRGFSIRQSLSQENHDQGGSKP